MTALYVRSAGAVTALGLDLDCTVASLRAGLDAFQSVPHAGMASRELQAASIRGFAEGVGGVPRYMALAERAISQCLEALPHAERARTALLVGLPRPGRPGVPSGLSQQLRKELTHRFELSADAVQTIELGRAAVFGGLVKARRWLAEQRFANCVVGGVDVLVNGDSLRGLSANRLLKEEWDGFIPGEAAAFVHLSTVRGNGPWNDACSMITGLGAASESARNTADDPLTGKAVVAAIRAAMRDAALPDSGVQLHINDVNGARADFEDNAMGRIRFFRSAEHEYQVWHLASFLGETGAASGALQLAWAASALDLGYAPGDGVLLTGSDGDVRASAVVQAAGTSGGPVRRQVSVRSACLHTPVPTSSSFSAPDPGLQLADEDLHAELAWRHMRELAWLWNLRSAHLQSRTKGWTDIEGYEQRLLSHLDALAWLDQRCATTLAAALEGEEAEDIAATMFALLCLPPDNGLLAGALEKTHTSLKHLQALTEVLPHAPAAVALPLLQRLAGSSRPEFAQAGLDGLAMMGRLDADCVRKQLYAAEATTAITAIRCAGMFGMHVLRDDILRSIERHERHDVDVTSGTLTKVALLAVGLDHADVAALEPATLARESPLACALLCLRENRSFTEFVRGLPATPALLEACGWVGEPTLITYLLEALQRSDASHVLAAAHSLQRLSDLSCKLSTPVALEEEDPESTAPLICTDASTWAAALHAEGLPARSAERLRYGRRWHHSIGSWHLRRTDCGFNERFIAAWEYAVLHRQGLPVHPGRFVSQQREELDRRFPNSSNEVAQ